MVAVRKNWVDPDRYGLKCPYPMRPTRIVVRNTGNDASAENEVAYMIRNDSEVGFHAAVDDVEVVQGIPFDRNAWACGDGNGKGNREGIHIEICYSQSGGTRFIQAEKNAAQYIAGLLKQYGWGLNRVTKHQDYNGKYCPHRTLDMGWARFLNMVENFWKEDEEMSGEEFYQLFKESMDRYAQELAQKPVAGWAEKSVAQMEAEGLMSRDAEGSLRPQSFATRQEVAVIAAGLLERGKE